MTKIVTMADLCMVVRSVASQRTVWSAPLTFDPSGPSPRLVYSDDVHDLWVLSWLPDQGTELHAHDGSAAAFTVVRGSLVEARPNPRGRLHSEVLPMGFTRWIAPGALHQVHNVDRLPAVSIHAYSPPLRSMTSYDARRGRLVPRSSVPLNAPATVGVA